MSGISSDLVSKSLGLDNTHIINDSLVDMEVIGQPAYKKRDLLDNEAKNEMNNHSEADSPQISDLRTYFP